MVERFLLVLVAAAPCSPFFHLFHKLRSVPVSPLASRCLSPCLAAFSLLPTHYSSILNSTFYPKSLAHAPLVSIFIISFWFYYIERF
ncbi:hypothetical protein ACE6H2_026666 [Prunus campanulata]